MSSHCVVVAAESMFAHLLLCTCFDDDEDALIALVPLSLHSYRFDCLNGCFHDQPTVRTLLHVALHRVPYPDIDQVVEVIGKILQEVFASEQIKRTYRHSALIRSLAQGYPS